MSGSIIKKILNQKANRFSGGLMMLKTYISVTMESYFMQRNMGDLEKA